MCVLVSVCARACECVGQNGYCYSADVWVDPTAEFLWSQHSTEGSHSDAEAPVESLLFKVSKEMEFD